MSQYTNFNEGYIAAPPKSSAGQIIAIIIIIIIILAIVGIVIYFIITTSTGGSSGGGGTTPTTSCKTNSDCSGGKKCNTSNGVCVNCLQNSDCASGQVCNPKNSTCVACFEDSQCSGTTPKCNVNTHTCVGCNTNNDCSGSTPLCDPNDFSCVQCIFNSDCPDPTTQACNVNGQCVNAFTCPNGVTCDGQTVNGVPNQTICTEGLRQYKCTSGGWQFDGNSCVCPVQQYFEWKGHWTADNFADAGGYPTLDSCNAWCTSLSNCNATMYDTTTGHCWLKNFDNSPPAIIYIRDPNNFNLYVTYNNKFMNGNDIAGYGGITHQQCITNCFGLGAQVTHWEPGNGNCYCKNTTLNGSDINYYTSFKETNY